MEVPEDADSYTLTGLQCGTRYQVYVTAFNHVGASQPSDAIPTKTLGRGEGVGGDGCGWNFIYLGLGVTEWGVVKCFLFFIYLFIYLFILFYFIFYFIYLFF